MKTFVSGIANRRLGFLHHHLKIAAILKLIANPLGVLLELGGVICL